jgi:hypothetical protein
MISKALLDAAKAFLCWDVFPDLAIQLVPLQHAVAYYYPPGSSLHGIVLFYDPAQRDFSEPLFLLFHEAGHACQWLQMQAGGQEELFHSLMGLDKGPGKVAFETEAWRLGKELFMQFAGSRDLGPGLSGRFESYGQKCVTSYDHG